MNSQNQNLKTLQQSVISLVQVAQADHGASRVAAQLLLSLYNGHSFLCNLAELSLLDEKNFEHALNAIRLRAVCCIEPHSLVPDGSKIFEQLAKDWWHLSRYERDRRLIEEAS